VTPVDRLLDAAQASISAGVREMCCRTATDAMSFQRAMENLHRTAQLDLSYETLRQVVEAEGKTAAKLQAEGKLPPGWTGQDCVMTTPPAAAVATAPAAIPVPAVAAGGTVAPALPAVPPVHAKTLAELGLAGPPRPLSLLCAGLDGVMAPMVTAAEKAKRYEAARQRRRLVPRRRGVRRRPLRRHAGADEKYKELKVAGVYDQKQVHRLVRITHRNSQHTGRVLAQICEDVLFGRAILQCAVTDGAIWIALQLALVLPGVLHILDFFHLAEHVHAARRIVYGENDKPDPKIDPPDIPADTPGKTWAAQVLHAARHQGYDAFWNLLVAKRAQTRRPAARKALDALMTYVAPRREMMDYPRYERLGLPIGSGPTESMCKVLTRRLKGPGMRWNPENAQALASLEALRQSDLWSAYWQTVLAA
jgi:hypothetical protein